MANKKKFQLVIVESPAKAKTIGQFLGDDFVVRSSYGHIRDLVKNNTAVDVANGFMPNYVIPDGKDEVVDELRKLAAQAEAVWLASDEDREGEAISWHLAEVLGLDVATTKRIAFHEITKSAIQQAIQNPRHINMDLVDAQQARRILDRLVGFELSPVLWRKVKSELSAGRVQSVAVRVIVEREREIFAFKPKSFFSVQAVFDIKDNDGKLHQLAADLNTHFDTIEQAEEFLAKCAKANFDISNVESKSLTRQPAPPFTTSTLQQEASRKLGYSVKLTMSAAQSLYEAGLITYMRTDSVNLSKTALDAAQEAINKNFGEAYSHRRQFKTNTKGAQEAHEAIRPTAIENKSAGSTPQEQRLYKLIWNRTVASQMADAVIERTSITIDTPVDKAHFSASADVIKFDGFMKLYLESNDNDDEEKDDLALPSVSVGQPLAIRSLGGREKWTQRPPRYNEASLVKKLEEMGIGRPSTYAPTITTIQDRGYVWRDTREGFKRTYRQVALQGQDVVRSEGTENYGGERNKLFPTDIGMVVNDFLVSNFNEVVSYDFTANVEGQFDEIAEGKLKWQSMLGEFYGPFHKTVDATIDNAPKCNGERLLGVDPKSGKNVYVRLGRYGSIAQIGEGNADADTPVAEKPKFASLRRDQYLETINLDDALKLFDLPRSVGSYEEKEVVIGTGRFGPYVRHDGKFVSLKKEDDPYSITLEQAIERIEAKREADRNKFIKAFDEDPLITVLNGRWGPYIAYGKANVKIPKGTDAAALTYQDCLKLCKDQNADPDKKKAAATRKSAAKSSKSEAPEAKADEKPKKAATAKKSTAKAKK